MVFCHQLVQVYDNSLDTTLSTTCKLLPQWSAPRRIVQRAGNSYTLRTLEGFPVPGWFHTRQLREFIPRRGTNLAIEEGEREAGTREQEDEQDGGDELESSEDEDGEQENEDGDGEQEDRDEEQQLDEG